MSTVAYKCPCCGAALAYSGASGKLECAACSNSYDLNIIEEMNAPQKGEGIQFSRPSETFNSEDASQFSAYICKNCGAELMTEDTTTATECPYCGSPTIIPDRIEGGVKPEMVIPFTVTKEDAQKQFENYFKGKRLLPNIFLNSRNRITEMRKLYVPYWLFNCDAEADISYEGKKSRTHRQGDWEIVRTRHYAVRRAGSLGFDNIPVDGSEKLDNKITESLEPYDLSAAVPFQPAVLSGALADHADVNAEACESRAVERVENSIADALRNTISGYDTVSERSRSFNSKGGKVTPVLMPVWLITTEKEGNTYTFAINGQTGKLTCDVPVAKGKAFGWGAGVFAGVFGVGAVLLALLEMLEGFPLLIAAVIALIVAWIVVSSMISSLQRAEFQSAASNYVRENSFNLRISHDHFLYETERRRKIETNNKKD